MVSTIQSRKFNTNLNPTIDRISQAAPQNDNTRTQLKNLVKNYIDSAIYAKQKPFLTFHQKVQNNQTMATRLDYIFIDENYEYLISSMKLLFGNSDHLLIEYTLAKRQKINQPSSWRFDK